MNGLKPFTIQLLSAIAGAMAFTLGVPTFARAGSIEFAAPGDATPADSSGGGIRGNIEFAPPGDATPDDSSGGGIRGSLEFAPPGDDAPADSSGGGIRGSLEFAPPGDAAPADSAGGGIRGTTNFQAPGDAAPADSAGGGIRGTTNFQAPGDAAPADSAGGGIRGTTNFQAPGDAAPGDSSSGGVRGEVQYQTPQEADDRAEIGGSVQADRASVVFPLLPDNHYGRTASAHPTLMVYVPPTATKQVFFSVQDQDRNPVYQTTLNISGEGGVVSITLPQSAPELEVGKTYTWYFAPIAPNGVLRPDNYTVKGWMKRVEAPQVPSSTDTTVIAQAKAYAEEGIWYDTVAILAAAQQAEPQNAVLADEWHDLLEQVGLEAVAQQPISDRL
jgi:Domain of Unknown Function (DUF928)